MDKVYKKEWLRMRFQKNGTCFSEEKRLFAPKQCVSLWGDRAQKNIVRRQLKRVSEHAESVLRTYSS
jgi:hypothetical protein